MGVNKIAEFYQSLSHLSLFSKRQFIHLRQTWKKLESNLRFFAVDLSDTWAPPGVECEKSKCQVHQSVFSIGTEPVGYTVDRLETQESWWYSSSLSLQAWEPGEVMVQIPNRAQRQRQLKDSEFHLYLLGSI